MAQWWTKRTSSYFANQAASRNRSRLERQQRADEDQLKRSLLFQYGPERTGDILSGEDDAYSADVESWRNLGQPKQEKAG